MDLDTVDYRKDGAIADPGFEAVRTIYETWMVDKNRCVWHEDAFDWWPSPLNGFCKS